jgi:paired amphipathic helix protein Sin3a
MQVGTTVWPPTLPQQHVAHVPVHPKVGYQQQPGLAVQGSSTPTHEHATAYIETMKERFKETPHVYEDFFKILKAFKDQTLNTKQVMQKVAELFSGQNEFILGFNQFLPAGYCMDSLVRPAAAGNSAAGGGGAHGVWTLASVCKTLSALSGASS